MIRVSALILATVLCMAGGASAQETMSRVNDDVSASHHHHGCRLHHHYHSCVNNAHCYWDGYSCHNRHDGGGGGGWYGCAGLDYWGCNHTPGCFWHNWHNECRGY